MVGKKVELFTHALVNCNGTRSLETVIGERMGLLKSG